MLKIEDLFVSYGHIMAVKGVDMEINEGEIVCLIGANGAGKTTIMQSISGLVPVLKGRIFFEGKNIAKEKSHKICSLGIAQVPEGRRIFSHLTVEDRVDIGRAGAGAPLFRVNRRRRGCRAVMFQPSTVFSASRVTTMSAPVPRIF